VDRFEGERSRLGQLQVEVVARLARSLGVELVKAESLRAKRERPDNPDAVDLAMEGWAAYSRPHTPGSIGKAADDFERAPQLDPNSPRALIGLSLALGVRATNFWTTTRAADFKRADDLANQALAIQPENANAPAAKALALTGSKQWDASISESDRAIEYDRNLAAAYADSGFRQVFIGHARVRGARNGAPPQSARSAAIRVGAPDLPPPQPSCAMGAGDRVVQEGGHRQPQSLLPIWPPPTHGWDGMRRQEPPSPSFSS
jgi:tetratricopeptide (TPR) repeat protein